MTTQDKIDLYKLHKVEYAAPQKPTIVDAKKAQYLTITGRGGPGGDEFTARIGALYGMAYTIKMTRKFSGEQDYVVCKLEAQYWCDGKQHDLSRVAQDEWRWCLMIRTPDFVSKKELEQAADVLLGKGKEPEVKDVKLESITEGRCVQMLHVGPYDREGETIAVMTEFAAAEGLEPHGRHHEIYLSDPRRVQPERLKTILRLPVRKRRA